MSIEDYAFYDCESLTSVTIPDGVTTIGYSAFYNCTSLTSVYYGGTASDWANISIDSPNIHLTSATRYYYSETQPTEANKYWHYVDGVPTVWEAAILASQGLEYTENSDGTYTVYLKILAPTQPMLELKFVIPNKKTAQRIYKNWEHKASDLYSAIYETLVD